MKTTELSFYNPSDLSERFFGPTIDRVSIDRNTGNVLIHKSTGVVNDLGSVEPFHAKNVEDVELLNGRLIVRFDDASFIDVGDVTQPITYINPTYTGEGIRVNDTAFKKLVSVDPKIAITQTADTLVIDVTVGNDDDGDESEGSELSGALDYFQSALYRDFLGTVTPIAIASLANTFVNRNITRQVINGIDVVANGDEYSLPAGTYYVEAELSANLCQYSYAELVDAATDEVLLTSIEHNVSSTIQTAVRYLALRGTITSNLPRTVKLRQYTQIASATGLFTLTGIPGVTVDYYSSSYIHFFKLTSGAVNLRKGDRNERLLPQICQDVKTFVDQYRDRTPVLEKRFYETSTTQSSECMTYLAPYLYTIGLSGGSGPYLSRWDTRDDTFKYYPLTGSSATLNWVRIVAAEDKVYLIPYQADNIAVFDTVTETITYTKMGVAMGNGGTKWGEGHYDALNKKIYCVPADAAGWLVINVETQTASIETFGQSMAGSNKYLNSVLTPDRKLYTIPFSGTAIQILDLATETLTQSTMGATLTGATKWVGGVYDPLTNKIFGVPFTATDILVIDLDTQTATRTAMGANLTGATKWTTAAYVKDGIVNILPGRSATTLLQINTQTLSAVIKTVPYGNFQFAESGYLLGDRFYIAPGVMQDSTAYFEHVTESLVFIDRQRAHITPSGSTGTLRWHGLGRGTLGNIYTVPFTLKECYAINTEKDRVGRLNWPLELGAMNYAGASLAKDGNVYLAPHTGREFARVVSPTELGTPNRVADVWARLDSRIPSLTSNSQNGYVLTGSGLFGGRDYFQLFNNQGRRGVADPIGYVSDARNFDGDNPHWVQLELPVAEHFDYYQHRLGSSNFPSSMAILASNDGNNWVRLLEFRDNSHQPFDWTLPRRIDDPTPYKFYRFEFYDGAWVSTVGLYAIKFYNEEDLAEPYYEVNPGSVRDDHASGILTADGAFNGFPVNRVGSDLTPNDRTHCWASANTALPHWIEYRRFTKHNVTAVMLTDGYNHYPRSLRVEASNDGRTWIPLATFTGLTNAQTYFEHPLFEFENTESYYAYRVLFLTSGSVNYVAVGTLKFLTKNPIDIGNPYGRVEHLRSLLTYATGTSYCWPIWNPSDDKLYFAPWSAGSWGVLDVDKMEFSLSLYGPIAQRINVANQNLSSGISPFDDSLISYAYAATTSTVVGGVVSQSVSAYVPFNNQAGEVSTGCSTIDETGVVWSSMSTATAHPLYDAVVGGTYSDYAATAFAGTLKYSGIALGPNGKLYSPPQSAQSYLEINPLTKETQAVSMGFSVTNGFRDARLTSDGCVLFGSMSGNNATIASCFYVLNFGPGISVPDSILESPYVA